MIKFVFSAHSRLAVDAAILFLVGLFASWPVVRHRWRVVAALPLALFRCVIRLIRPRPTIARTAAVIFAFNGLAIFVYMASGFHPMLPKIFAIWTGLNVGVLVGLGRDDGPTQRLDVPPEWWRPSPPAAFACGLAVLVVELPCFWYSLAMGMSMGHAVQAKALAYPAALGERAAAYGAVVLPLLLLSALAEAVAIRGSAAIPPSAEGP